MVNEGVDGRVQGGFATTTTVEDNIAEDRWESDPFY